MKKLLIIMFQLTVLSHYGQKVPNVTGPCSLNIGQQVTYTLNAGDIATPGSSPGQCIDCYDWDINNTNSTSSGNVQIIGSDQNQSVVIKGLTNGTFSLKVTFFSESGCNVATFLCAGANPIVGVIPPCNITTNPSFTFTNNTVTNMLTLVPLPQNSLYTYDWEITYNNNLVATANGVNAQISNCNGNSPVKSIKLTISSSICSKSTLVNYTNTTCPLPSRLSFINIKNPIKNILDIEKSNIEKFEGKIYDLNGNQVGSFNETDYQTKDFSTLKNNLYLVKIKDVDGQEILSQKIIKE